MRAHKLDMLHGPIWSKFPRFALPVAATAILEQLFNASDIAVVGNFTGAEKTAAVAAVGANSPIIGLSVNLFIGVALGTNVVIAHAVGEGDKRWSPSGGKTAPFPIRRARRRRRAAPPRRRSPRRSRPRKAPRKRAPPSAAASPYFLKMAPLRLSPALTARTRAKFSPPPRPPWKKRPASAISGIAICFISPPGKRIQRRYPYFPRGICAPRFCRRACICFAHSR